MTQAKRQIQRLARYIALLEEGHVYEAHQQLTERDREYIKVDRQQMLEEQGESEEVDDDPQCVCGVYRSEHAMMGCPEGFQTAKQWEAEKEFIGSLDDWEYERIYGEG